MAVLLHIKEAFKRYGDQVLLDEAEATLVDNAKVGFVGRNGAGKSTLLRIMLGEEELDSGQVIRHPKLRIGYLRQHDPFTAGESALDFLMRDSGRPEWKCGEVAGRFEIKGTYLEGPIAALSGGWQTRVKLAALLLHDPNLLLLDEPTNFLDLRTQILLEHFLRGFNQACLIVSHDRAFLRAICTQTLDLTRGKLTLFPGTIDAFLEHQEQRREHDRRVNATVIAKQKQLERFITKNRAKASTASQARSKSKQLERLQTIEIRADEPTAHIRAPRVTPRQGPAVRCDDLAIGYRRAAEPDQVVARGIDLEIEHGQRTAIVGDNGQGKTTLLRTLVESLPPLAGTVRWGHGCVIGTYAQHVYGTLPEPQTVVEYLEHKALFEKTQQQILAVAGALLFREDHVKKKIAVLSGGERARLCLAGLLLGDYNILVLDEPGNHLDVQTVDALADALLAYSGTVVFTSHDRYFLKRVTTAVIEVRDGNARHYSGSYDAYLYSVNREIDEGERQLASAGKRQSKPGRPATRKTSQPRQNDRAVRKEVSRLESRITELEQRRATLNQALLAERDPETALRLHNDITAIAAELAGAEHQWCVLQERLES